MDKHSKVLDIKDDLIKKKNISGYIRKIIGNSFGNSLCCLSLKYTDFNWDKIYIYEDKFSYLVYYTDEHPVYKFVIRPAKKYNDFHFIGLFEFGINCSRYREDQMVALIK